VASHTYDFRMRIREGLSAVTDTVSCQRFQLIATHNAMFKHCEMFTLLLNSKFVHATELPAIYRFHLICIVEN